MRAERSEKKNVGLGLGLGLSLGLGLGLGLSLGLRLGLGLGLGSLGGLGLGLCLSLGLGLGLGLSLILGLERLLGPRESSRGLPGPLARVLGKAKKHCLTGYAASGQPLASRWLAAWGQSVSWPSGRDQEGSLADWPEYQGKLKSIA